MQKLNADNMFFKMGYNKIIEKNKLVYYKDNIQTGLRFNIIFDIKRENVILNCNEAPFYYKGFGINNNELKAIYEKTKEMGWK